MALSRIRERSLSKPLCFRIEAITQIVSIERSRPGWLPMSVNFRAKAEYPYGPKSIVRKITSGKYVLPIYEDYLTSEQKNACAPDVNACAPAR
ncbi:MAG: hypothetical protein KGK16_16360, partial [Bradyrhizobium sp.]|nr:hypothetical protein [Bradyrhizobium sp.]